MVAALKVEVCEKNDTDSDERKRTRVTAMRRERKRITVAKRWDSEADFKLQASEPLDSFQVCSYISVALQLHVLLREYVFKCVSRFVALENDSG